MDVSPPPAATPAALPFTSREEEQKEPLDDVLVRRYLKSGLQWLVGNNFAEQVEVISAGNGQPPMLTTNCWWGIGLCIESLLRAQELPRYFTEERDMFTKQAMHLAQILISKQDPNDYSWDKVTWDTSVIADALLHLAKHLRAAHHGITKWYSLVSDIELCVRRCLGWLVAQAIRRGTARYAFGPEDLGMIVLVLCSADEYGHDIFPKGLQTPGELAPRELIAQLVGYLIDLQTESVSSTSTIEFKHLDAPYSGAHLLLAFERAFPFLPSDLQGKVISCTVSVIEDAEKMQEAGRWGLPSETALMLQGYTAAGHIIRRVDSSFRPKPEIVFRALRWLTDEKQRFVDGSILHLFDCTAFFVLALESLIADTTDGDFLRLNVPQVYDYVLWNEQMNVSQERAERLRMTESYYFEKRLNVGLLRSVNTYVGIIRAGGVASIVLASLGVAIQFGWSPQLLMDPSFTIAYGTAVASMVSIFLVVTRRLVRRLDG